MHKLEKKIVIILNKYHSKILDAFSSAISNVPFLILFWFMITAVILYRDLLTGIVVMIALVLVFAAHFIISEGVIKFGAKILSLQRIRPYVAYPKEIRGIGKRFSDSSFPSSHMAAMVGGLFVLVYFYNAFLIWAILITLIMAWSRLRNGMHYPSDVLAGIAFGLIYGWCAIGLLKIII